MHLALSSPFAMTFYHRGRKFVTCYREEPAAETARCLLFKCPFLGVIPVLLDESACVRTTKARRESFRKDSGQAGMTEIWDCGRDHRVYLDDKAHIYMRSVGDAELAEGRRGEGIELYTVCLLDRIGCNS